MWWVWHYWCKEGHRRHWNLTSSARLVLILIFQERDWLLEYFSDFPIANRYHNSAVYLLTSISVDISCLRDTWCKSSLFSGEPMVYNMWSAYSTTVPDNLDSPWGSGIPENSDPSTLPSSLPFPSILFRSLPFLPCLPSFLFLNQSPKWISWVIAGWCWQILESHLLTADSRPQRTLLHGPTVALTLLEQVNLGNCSSRLGTWSLSLQKTW